ncbi:MAG: hypothetical protein OXF73_09225, partial [Gammaproteobacteria bacterium]|nr:hypothetical protein [Gammaproteobacteria bacterium]
MQHFPLSVHEASLHGQTGGGIRVARHPVSLRNGDSLDFPALQATQSGPARPAAGPAGVRIQRPPLRTRRRISPVRGSGREQALVKDLERRAAAQRL